MNTDTQKLIDIYFKAQMLIIKTIAEKEARGNVTYYQKSLLMQINRQIAELDAQARQWTNDVIEKYYKDAIDEVSAILEKDISNFESFAKLHTSAIEMLVQNTYSKLNEANNFVGRRINDAIRNAGIEAVTMKVATGQTVRECKKSLIEALTKEGINGIRDKRGRMISLAVYAETVARSTTAEVTNTATTNQLTSLGYDLVKMTSHVTSCPICSVYQGRVYSISGNDSRFPKLDTVFSGEYANIHPNCRHRIFPYIPELADDLQNDISESNRSFEVDPRSKKSIDEYNKQQKEKVKLNNDRQQYQRYKLVFGKDAPKNFAGFRKMKYSSSGKYQELESEYRSIMVKEGKKD